jgi:hypothetical protein
MTLSRPTSFFATTLVVVLAICGSPLVAHGEATNQPFLAKVEFRVGDDLQVLGEGVAVFGTPSMFATPSEFVELVIATSEDDMGDGLHELTFNYFAVNPEGRPTPFVMMPVDELVWSVQDLVWADERPYKIISDEGKVFDRDGNPLGMRFNINTGQTGVEFDVAIPLTETEAKSQAFSLTQVARAEYRAVIQHVPEPNSWLLLVAATGLMLRWRRR